MTRLWHAVLLAVVAFGAAGCDMLSFFISENGDGDFFVSVPVNEDTLPFMSLEGVPPDTADVCDGEIPQPNDALIDIPNTDIPSIDSFTVRTNLVELEDECLLITFAFWNADEAADVFEALSTDERPFPLSGNLEDGWTFELDTAEIKSRAVSFATLDGYEPTVTVTLPGETFQDNADRSDDGLYVWEIDLDNLDELPDTLYATTQVDTSLPPEMFGLIILAILMVAVVVVIVVVETRKERDYL